MSNYEPLATSSAGVPAGWQLRGTEPAAIHVTACRFDKDMGEWVYAIVLTPLAQPFTHWRMLDEPPNSAALLSTAPKPEGGADGVTIKVEHGERSDWPQKSAEEISDIICEAYIAGANSRDYYHGRLVADLAYDYTMAVGPLVPTTPPQGVEELRAASEAATPGLWRVYQPRADGGFPGIEAGDNVSIVVHGNAHDLEAGVRGTEPHEADARDNAAFIVACVNHVRAALTDRDAR